MYDPSQVPAHTLPGLTAYRDQRATPGSFLAAVLSNDLKEACLRADDMNQKALYQIVCWCYNELPSGSWGSKEAVERWLTSRD